MWTSLGLSFAVPPLLPNTQQSTHGFQLQMLPLDVPVAEHRLEADLRKSLTEHRAEVLGIPATQWDEGLAFLLMPALASYEAEAVTGQPAAGTEDFQQSIKRSTPAGSTFKGVPQHHRCGHYDVLPDLWGVRLRAPSRAANAARLQTNARGCAPAPQVRPEGGQSINRSMLAGSTIEGAARAAP